MYQLSRTVPVNEPKKSFLSRHDVWNGLLMKANNALPYVPEMKKCDVVEQGDGWLVRDIMLKDVPLREKVTFEPEKPRDFRTHPRLGARPHRKHHRRGRRTAI